MAFIYVLHFQTSLHHALHYAGCTTNIKKRLIAHARGAGSHITRAVMKEGIGFALASLMTCSKLRMRELERGLKDQHNAKRYCSICSNPPDRLVGTEHYPVEELGFPLKSCDLLKIATPQTVQTVRLTKADESADTMKAIIDLMKADKDALGFIPAGGTGGLNTIIHRGLIALAMNAGEIVGYTVFNMNPSKTRLAIHQCCVRDDARLQGYGRAMIQLVTGTHPVDEVTAKVRTDLAANHFWNSLGFNVTQTKKHKTSGNDINHYSMPTKKE